MGVNSSPVIQAVNQTNISAATRYWPSSDGQAVQSAFELVVAMVLASGVTLTVEHAAMTEDEKVPAAGDWQDVTDKSVALVGTAAASYVDTTAEIALVLPRGRFRIKYITSDGSNTVRISITRRHITDAAILQAGLLAQILSASSAPPVAEYNATTPSATTTDPRNLEVSKAGSAFVDATVRHQREIVPLAVSGAGAAATLASLTEGPCNGISVDTDDVHVFGQPVERGHLVVNGSFDSDTNWTKGAGWTIANSKATHAAGSGATTLVQDTSVENPNDQVQVGRTYAVYFEVLDRTAGDFTCKLGTGTATAAISANGGYIALLTAATNGDITFTAADAFDGSIRNVRIMPASPKLKAGQIYPLSYVSVVAVATAAAITTFTSNRIVGHWLRRIGATELT